MEKDAIKALLQESNKKLYHLTSFREKFLALHGLWLPYLKIDFPDITMEDHPSDSGSSRASVDSQSRAVLQAVAVIERKAVQKRWHVVTAFTDRKLLKPEKDKINLALRQAKTVAERAKITLEFFAKMQTGALKLRQLSLAQSSQNLDSSSRKAAFLQAKDCISVMHPIMQGVTLQDMMTLPQQKNAYTGFYNFNATTGYINVVLQMLCHCPEIRLLVEDLAASGPTDNRKTLAKHLWAIMQWHGKYESVAPLELVHHLFEHFAGPWGLIANEQGDAPELTMLLLALFAMDAQTIAACCISNVSDELLDASAGRKATLNDWLQILSKLAPEENKLHCMLRVCVLTNMPCYRDATSRLQWLHMEITDWNEPVDLSAFSCGQTRQPIRHYLQTAVFHLHRHDSAEQANIRCGHYVATIRKGDSWYMFNDDYVRHIEMQDVAEPPCVMLFTTQTNKSCATEHTAKLGATLLLF